MTPSKVSIKAVADYDPDKVLSGMRACLEPLGGMKSFVRPGQRVLLKPNLVIGFGPERAATTHPSVLRAVILLVQEAGGTVKIGDSPGLGTLAGVAHAAGYTPVLKETGAELVDFKAHHEFEEPTNTVGKKIILTHALLEADVFITLPKLKTHAQMFFTGAIKNQYGLIPGALKSQWHFRLQQKEWLAKLLVDINRIARPSLAIMDAIVGMEGPGPTGGKPRHIGALLASRDLSALDVMACQLINLNPRQVPALIAAEELGFGQTNPRHIEAVGDDWKALRVSDFEHVTQLVDMLRLIPLPQPVLRWIRRQWTSRPRISDEICTRCGVCAKVCPVSPSAIHPGSQGKEQLDEERCIACYCCHELCPNKAIELSKPWISRMLPMTKIADSISRMKSR